MTFLGRKWWAFAVVCLAVLAAGCGGGSGSTTLQITTTSLPAGNVNNPYSTVVSLTGGTSPYTWSITSGTLPAGLTFGTGTGSIAGLPTTAGTTNLTLTVTDSSSPVETATVSLSLLIGNVQVTFNGAPVGAATVSLPSGSLNVAYTAPLGVSDAGDPTGPFTWSVSSGALPVWATLNASTGAITGTPTVGGVSNFTLQVVDSENPTVTATGKFSMSISPLTLSNTSLPNGLQNTMYSFTFDAQGGAPPYTWSIETGLGFGTLPQGLSLNTSTGLISGTPTAPGTYPFTLHVVDSESPAEAVTETFQLTIEPASGACASASAPTGNESLLNGNYAFLVQGFEGVSPGSAVAIAGSFNASGGQITSGELDVSDVTDSSSGANHYTLVADAPLSLYTVGLDPSGSGNVGCAMLTTSAGTTMTFHFSLGGVNNSGVVSKGKIIEFDDASGAGTIASGVIALQDATAFAANKLSPNYAFGLDGQTLSGQPLAAAGSFSVNSSGAISEAAADVDIGGNPSSLSGGGGSISGLSATDGRGSASITLSGAPSAAPLSWTIYVVNSTEAYVVNTTLPAGGRMLATAGPFNSSSLAGNYVVYGTGITTCGSAPCADVNVGLIDLASGGTFSGPFWEYNVGLPSGVSPSSPSGRYFPVGSSLPSSGRFTLPGAGSSGGLVGYFVSPQVDGINAVLVGTDAAAHFGFATLQSGTSVPAEQLIFGTLDPRSNTTTTYAGTAGILRSGALSGTEDSSSQSGGRLDVGSSVTRTVILGQNGTGSAATGSGTNIAVTDGSRLFWFDAGGAPAAITVAEPQ